jgi:hypothetical protein
VGLPLLAPTGWWLGQRRRGNPEPREICVADTVEKLMKKVLPKLKTCSRSPVSTGKRTLPTEMELKRWLFQSYFRVSLFIIPSEFGLCSGRDMQGSFALRANKQRCR